MSEFEPVPHPPAMAPAPALQGRLPPISLLFLLIGTVRQLLIPLVASAVAAPGIFSLWFLVLGVPAVMAALVRLWTFSYTLQGDELEINQGLFTRTERNIPLHRIQNLDLVENPLHRYFGVAEVRLETASGGKPEAVIRVLTQAQIKALRQHLDAARSTNPEHASTLETGAAEPAPPPPLLTQTPRELAILGLLSNRGMLVVAAALGLLQQTGVFDNPERFEAIGAQLPGFLEGFDPSSFSLVDLGLFAALATVVFIVLTRLLSVVWVLLTLFNFTLRHRGDDFSTSYGLFTRVTATLPRRRLQLLSLFRPFLARPWELASVKVETAGGGGSNERQGPGAARLWLAPLVAEGKAQALVREAMSGIEPESVEWRPLAPRAAARVTRRNAMATFVLGLAVTALVESLWGLLFLPLVALVGWVSLRSVRRSAWGFAHGVNGDRRAIFFRSGPFDQRESLVPLGKIQCVSLQQSPFDRRWGMATLRVDTAGASAGGHRVEVPYLDADMARGLARELADAAAETTFLW